MHLNEAIKITSIKLATHHCPGSDAAREAVELVAFAAEIDRAHMTGDEQLTENQADLLNLLVDRRLNHEPLPHLLGSAIFLGREYAVSPEVLTPRPATEIIASELIEDCRNRIVTVADIGTGSGCAAISFALELPEAQVVATDTSLAALNVATNNVKRLGVNNRLILIHTDLLPAPFPTPPQCSLVIFANLPYIPTADIDGLAPDVRDYEPRVALDGGSDGLDLYRELFRRLQLSGQNKFQAYLEALPNQLTELAAIVRRHYPDAVTIPITADSTGQTKIGLKIRI
jgi:release factor glutamine methyltransferase